MNPVLPENARHFRLAIAPGFRIDPTTGALLDVSLIAGGREAKGHGIYIDDKTLETALECIQSAGGRLKSYVTHNHGGPASWSMPDMDDASSELNIPGYFSDISIKNGQLVAGRFDFYNAFKKNFAPQYEQLLEMAQTTPDLIGLSIEPCGYAVYVDKDGNEYGGEPEDTELLYNGLPALRVTDLFAAAFVSDPAANDGLFAKLSRGMFGGKQSQGQKFFKALVQTFNQLGEDENPAAPVSVYTQSHSKDTQTMNIITGLKTKFGNDQKKFAAAMLIVGNKPDITIEAVEAEMIQVELAETNGQITSLTANLATANVTIGTLTTERDTVRTELAAEKLKLTALQSRFDSLKSSGIDPLLLGAPNAGTVVAPTVNLTGRARAAAAIGATLGRN